MDIWLALIFPDTVSFKSTSITLKRFTRSFRDIFTKTYEASWNEEYWRFYALNRNKLELVQDDLDLRNTIHGQHQAALTETAIFELRSIGTCPSAGRWASTHPEAAGLANHGHAPITRGLGEPPDLWTGSTPEKRPRDNVDPPAGNSPNKRPKASNPVDLCSNPDSEPDPPDPDNPVVRSGSEHVIIPSDNSSSSTERYASSVQDVLLEDPPPPYDDSTDERIRQRPTSPCEDPIEKDFNEIMARVVVPDKRPSSSPNPGANDDGPPGIDTADVYEEMMGTPALAKLLKELHERTRRVFRLSREAFENPHTEVTVPGFKKFVSPWQLDKVVWVLDKGRSQGMALDGFDMGLGKTRSSLFLLVFRLQFLKLEHSMRNTDSRGHLNASLWKRDEVRCPLQAEFPYECLCVPGSVARSWDLPWGPALVLVPANLVNEWIAQYHECIANPKDDVWPTAWRPYISGLGMKLLVGHGEKVESHVQKIPKSGSAELKTLINQLVWNPDKVPSAGKGYPASQYLILSTPGAFKGQVQNRFRKFIETENNPVKHVSWYIEFSVLIIDEWHLNCGRGSRDPATFNITNVYEAITRCAYRALILGLSGTPFNRGVEPLKIWARLAVPNTDSEDKWTARQDNWRWPRASTNDFGYTNVHDVGLEIAAASKSAHSEDSTERAQGEQKLKAARTKALNMIEPLVMCRRVGATLWYGQFMKELPEHETVFVVGLIADPGWQQTLNQRTAELYHELKAKREQDLHPAPAAHQMLANQLAKDSRTARIHTDFPGLAEWSKKWDLGNTRDATNVCNERHGVGLFTLDERNPLCKDFVLATRGSTKLEYFHRMAWGRQFLDWALDIKPTKHLVQSEFWIELVLIARVGTPIPLI